MPDYSSSSYPAILDAARYLSELPAIRATLENIDEKCIRPNDGKKYSPVQVEWIESFRKGQPGHNLVQLMMGELIGPVDLLIIDEAHKSRDQVRGATKVMAKLIEEILITDARRSRRFCLKATSAEKA